MRRAATQCPSSCSSTLPAVPPRALRQAPQLPESLQWRMPAVAHAAALRGGLARAPYSTGPVRMNMKTAALVLRCWRFSAPLRASRLVLKNRRSGAARAPDEPRVERVQHRHCGARSATSAALHVGALKQARRAPAGSRT